MMNNTLNALVEPVVDYGKGFSMAALDAHWPWMVGAVAVMGCAAGAAYGVYKKCCAPQTAAAAYDVEAAYAAMPDSQHPPANA